MSIPFGLLIASQRSGTGALGSILDKHPQLRYLGEVLHPNNVGDKTNYFTHLINRSSMEHEAFLPDRNNDNFNTFIAKVTEPNITPILDIKYNSLHHFNGAWQPPSESPWIIHHARSLDVPIIHLTRFNLVEVFVSGRLAEANKVWHAVDVEQLKTTKIKIDPHQLLRFLISAQQDRQIIERWLTGYSRIVTVDYSELFDNSGLLNIQLADQIAKIFDVNQFQDLAPFFIKQSPKKLIDSVENFQSVKEMLSGTPFEWMIGEKTAKDSKSKLEELTDDNRKALDQISAFRGKQSPEMYGHIDAAFHWYKNHYPYFGPIDVKVGPYSVVMYSGNDDLVAMTYFWYGTSSFERHSVSIWTNLCKDAKIVYDIGAHSALYSLLAAQINPNCKIMAFEPCRRTHGRILLNSYMNKFENRISAKCLAISDKVGQKSFFQYRGENILGIGGSLLEKNIKVTDDSEIVDTITLDTFCETNHLWPDLMKIDVEGAEVLALTGAKQLLVKNHPRMIIEITPGTALDIYHMLKDEGYTLSIIDEDKEEMRPFEGSTSKVLNVYARVE